jgi:hypothetical protein
MNIDRIINFPKDPPDADGVRRILEEFIGSHGSIRRTSGLAVDCLVVKLPGTKTDGSKQSIEVFCRPPTDANPFYVNVVTRVSADAFTRSVADGIGRAMFCRLGGVLEPY